MEGLIHVLLHGKLVGVYYDSKPNRTSYPCINIDTCCDCVASSCFVCKNICKTITSGCTASLSAVLLATYPQLESYDTALPFALATFPELQI